MSVHAKLLEAQRSVDAVVKRGVNEAQRYKYAMAADVVGVCRKALHGAGLVGAIDRVMDRDSRAVTTDKGRNAVYAEVVVELRITDPETGESVYFDAVGAGHDQPGDKALLKATTAATKYAYSNALALPFADHDPERDVPGEAGRLPEQKADPQTALPDEEVDAIAKLYGASGFSFDRLSVAIGSVGGEAPKINRKDSIRKAVASLSAEQAAKLGNILDAAAKS